MYSRTNSIKLNPIGLSDAATGVPGGRDHQPAIRANNITIQNKRPALMS